MLSHMGIRTVCIHQMDGETFQGLVEWRVKGVTKSREELRQVLAAVRPDALILDLDLPGAMDVVVEAREISPTLGIVGVIGENDPKIMIAALREGCKQLTTKPIDLNDVEAALRRTQAELPHQDVCGQVIGVIGAQGGAGATTVACYLAVSLAEVSQGRSLIIDCDFDFGSVARAWDVNPQHTIEDIVSAGTVDSHMLEKAAVELPGGISVLARPKTIEAGHAIDECAMAHIIKTAQTVYPFTVLDLPRKLDAVIGAGLELCNRVAIVLQLTVPALDNARRLMDALMNAGMPVEQIELVVNRYRKNVHMLSPDIVEKQMKKPLFGIVPNDYKSVASSIDVGQPMAARSPVRVAISEMAGRLAGMQHSHAPTGGGWLEKLGLRKARAGAAT